jgi:hypothetical protein
MSPTMLIFSSIQPAVKALTIKPVNGGRNRVVPDQQGIRLALDIQLSSYLFMVIFCGCHAGITSFPGSVSRTSPGIRVVQSRGQLAGNSPQESTCTPYPAITSILSCREADYLRHF